MSWTAAVLAVAMVGAVATPAQALPDQWAIVVDAFVGQDCVDDVCVDRTLTSVAFPVEPVPQVPSVGDPIVWVGGVLVTFVGGEQLPLPGVGQENPPCDVYNLASEVVQDCDDSPLIPNEAVREVENLFTKTCLWNAELHITKGGATVFFTNDAKFLADCPAP